MLPWLPPAPVRFPHASTALSEPDGLLCAGGELSPEWLLAAYPRGIFPWFSPGDPILWWSPDPRMVLKPEEVRVRRSLAKRLRNAGLSYSIDRDFTGVINACASIPRDGQAGTWILPEMQQAYIALHAMGHAHSVEVWQGDSLVGGLYGVACGRIFFGESMFSRVPDASKLALVILCQELKARDFPLIDCQMHTPHLASLGARSIARSDFISYLDQYATGQGHEGKWSLTSWPTQHARE
ncbi:leucyl/phenylalanyl-tRNA--protein transferase [Cobetia amphilecti]|jgi:leucyl/phenylalanyl-tRNA--protein transferase|uniref:Leucyl/phenylalanyl-tRNA--protein transferase n=1 Tax=Cobetia amphilecti TaxID=1055104 RepID=A0AAP4WY67_9GAMM|nr:MULTISPECIES: leucyl/phenylalanyl-tRNA--protein transferase [Cobetia]MBR9755287.1 leucyl/phenylalanyl-tRNA--protein transferase [Gammaproteobacteria bacterium]TCJ26920.1 leucyl/phenylalanyl-tRNA--protein transferase [Halomonas sp. GDM18]KGA02122.1 leucyl/phenylalanyl-tRNA--protein transferase [Cobetia amphilecti]KPM81033.1 leucyl/phenylalanyl-tRNA--protein transferase [Cobetia sp. UCD-24C]MBE2166969.1 leucyl/phenylalanyl-tRNA--protein transferase [Cobetia sp. 2AS1]|tara:strand:- start:866 stop:1582 length:717 start_codon:yes stop_codon:yes gene_type:complete